MSARSASARLALTLAPLVWREWLHHRARHAVALFAVSLGVALAWSVHLINRSALAEFAAAVRSVNGQADLSLRGQREGFDDAAFERVADDADVQHAGALIELETYARAGPGAPREPVRVLGLDALRMAPLAPALLPVPATGEPSQVVLDAGVVFVNRAMRERLGAAGAPGAANRIELQSGARWITLRIAGDVAVGGPPLVVLDLSAAQQQFGHAGRITRIDVRLVPGRDVAVAATELPARAGLPAFVQAVVPEAHEERLSNLSRAYRVNLTVLALVALLVGAFLVYSVVSLAVAQRQPALALLGVLGLTARGRQRLVMAECALVGVAGGALGVALGTALAALALRALAGDLGGGYFPGVQPALAWSSTAAAVFVALGAASAVAGGYLPARAARRLVPAQALKGLGEPAGAAVPWWPAALLLALGALLAFVPPVGGLPLAAYAAVAALLCGGLACVPWVVHGLTAARPPGRALAWLAWRRAAFYRGTATAATAGVVASLALTVAITVMVTSFRTSVAQWLDEVLPADLYARAAASASLAETAWWPADIEARAAALPGVRRASASRVRSLQLAPGRPSVTLLARPLAPLLSGAAMGGAMGAAAAGSAASAASAAAESGLPLALLAPPLPPHGQWPDVFVSEAVQAIYGVRPGDAMELPLAPLTPLAPLSRAAPAPSPPHAATAAQARIGTAAAAGLPATQRVHVRGVYRDFARQFGSITIERAVYRRLTGDERLTDLALWLSPGTEPAAVMGALRRELGDPALADFATAGELRAVSLRIFDRSFAVTYYLQAVAIAIGLVGVAASLSAQVLARRKEFGLLSHLGLTRSQLIAVVAGEAAAWVAAGSIVGLGIGLLVSAVLVHVVNPQSFHWTMEMVLPGGRLALLTAAVFLAGTLTAAWAARGAAARSAVLSVKEDW